MLLENRTLLSCNTEDFFKAPYEKNPNLCLESSAVLSHALNTWPTYWSQRRYTLPFTVETAPGCTFPIVFGSEIWHSNGMEEGGVTCGELILLFSVLKQGDRIIVLHGRCTQTCRKVRRRQISLPRGPHASCPLASVSFCKR